MPIENGQFAERPNGGKVMLSGVSEEMKRQMRKTETTGTIPEEELFMAQETIRAATIDAFTAARSWLEKSESESGH